MYKTGLLNNQLTVPGSVLVMYYLLEYSSTQCMGQYKNNHVNVINWY